MRAVNAERPSWLSSRAATSAASAAVAVATLILDAGCRRHVASENITDAAPQPPPSAAAVAATSPDPAPPAHIIQYPSAPGSFIKLVEEARDSVVHIRTSALVSGGPASIYPGADEDHALGTGIITSSDGFILTNAHVVASAPDLRVILANGKSLVATRHAIDEPLDIALLKVAASPDLVPANLGRSGGLAVGQWVLAIGNPAGLELSASAGVITSRGREDDVMARPPDNLRGFLHTDAAIDPSNSGGPLLNMAGQVVGINTAARLTGSRLGLAIPIDQVRDILPMLTRDGQVSRTWLGAFVLPVTAADAARLGLPTTDGARVSRVVPRGPAAKGGVAVDDVIVEYDGQRVDDRTLPWLASVRTPYSRVQVVLWRGGGARTIEVIAEPRPE